jgi:hypothetical protein
MTEPSTADEFIGSSQWNVEREFVVTIPVSTRCAPMPRFMLA